MDAPTPLHAQTAAQEVFTHFITFAHIFRAFVLSLMALLRRIAMYIPLKAKQLSNPSLSLKVSDSFSLDAAGLVALADLTTVQERTALTGSSTLLDALVICPGLHMQQRAVEIHGGEHPACGAMTTGFVFRVENPATVYYLQTVGRTGKLTTLEVSSIPDDRNHWGTWLGIHVFSFHNASSMGSVAYAAAVLWGIAVIIMLVLMQDWWGVACVGLLVLSRLCNVLVIRRRNREVWSGAKEPKVKGDLLILLSQDRWIRMKGLVDDLKAVTSGQWLRDPTNLESWVTAFATIIVYLDAALASNVTQAGKILLLTLLIGSVGLLAIANASTDQLQMRGCVVKVQGERRAYRRRLDLVHELMEETHKRDWATRMGLFVPVDSQPDLQTDGHKRVEM